MRSGIKIKREVKNKKLDLVWEIKRFERALRLMRSENTPEGRVVNLFP